MWVHCVYSTIVYSHLHSHNIHTPWHDLELQMLDRDSGYQNFHCPADDFSWVFSFRCPLCRSLLLRDLINVAQAIWIKFASTALYHVFGPRPSLWWRRNIWPSQLSIPVNPLACHEGRRQSSERHSSIFPALCHPLSFLCLVYLQNIVSHYWLLLRYPWYPFHS